MKNLIKSVIKRIGDSIKDKNGKTSSSRISAFFMLGSITLTTTIFTCIEIVNAFISWFTGDAYVIPSAHIIIFGMILTHHLTLLGINKITGKEKVDKVSDNK